MLLLTLPVSLQWNPTLRSPHYDHVLLARQVKIAIHFLKNIPDNTITFFLPVGGRIDGVPLYHFRSDTITISKPVLLVITDIQVIVTLLLLYTTVSVTGNVTVAIAVTVMLLLRNVTDYTIINSTANYNPT